MPVVLPGTASPVVAPTRYVPFPYDFEVRWAPEGSFPQTSLVLAFGQTAVPLPFQVWNTTLDRQQDVLLVEDNPDLRNGRWDPGDLVVLVDGVTPGATPTQAGGNWRAGWAFRLLPPDAGVAPRAPAPGAVLAFSPTKPFATGDYIDFSFTAPAFDAAAARETMREVYVVPNPYVATSTFEPANPYVVGAASAGSCLWACRPSARSGSTRSPATSSRRSPTTRPSTTGRSPGIWSPATAWTSPTASTSSTSTRRASASPSGASP